LTRMNFTIRGDADRISVSDMVRTLKDGMRVEIKHGLRSPEQSNLMWARLNDIAEQVTWHGQRLEPVDWKDMFTAGLRRARVVPNIDGDGFVQLGLHTSDLTKEEMSNLLDLMDAFAAQHGVTFKEHDSSSSAVAQPSQGRHGTVDDASGADGSHQNAPGVNSSEEASLLSDDWRSTYFNALTNAQGRATSLLTRHQQAMQMLGGEPNAAELAWMRRAWRAVEHRDTGKIKFAEYEARVAHLMTVPLAEIMGRAA
jgi:hypothetical protein